MPCGMLDDVTLNAKIDSNHILRKAAGVTNLAPFDVVGS